MVASWKTGLAVASLGLIGGQWMALAQENNQQQDQPQVARAAERSDQQLALMLIDEDDLEVAVAQLIVEKTRNDEVKSFAQKMIKQHTEARGKLVQLTGLAISGEQRNPNAQQPNPSAQPVRNQGNAANPNANPNAQSNPQTTDRRPGERGGRQPNQQLDFVAICHEMKEQCLASATEEIGKKEGKELDKCYIGMQLAAHPGALTKAKVFKNHASPALQAFLGEREKTVEDHLKMAKKIMKGLEEESSKKSGKDD